MENFKVSVVIPSYNEEQNIPVLAQSLSGILEKYPDYEIIFVNDGSSDKTLDNIKKTRESNDKIHYVSFSRNFGHQNALRAGLDAAKGDCIVSMDADMQHPPEIIPDLIDKWLEGWDIVYTIREDSKKLSFFKRKSASMFYGIINKLANLQIEKGAADFRLLDRKVVDALKLFRERSIFYRGIISWMGFKQLGIRYKPADRLYGESKYTLKKMFAFALNGITSFSVVPLHISTVLGIIISILSFAYGLYSIIIKIFTNKTISGWTSIMVGIFFLGGIQLIMLGIIGEYIGKLFIEIKGRPSYIVEEKSID
ncbi:MAG TPA: glycosyltransferase family 2 protein [Spirochaetota bacterium]|jgi:dolichol-phosphate mannosyltransferase|nr:MAG: hypothetical protein BWX91_00628 [Spirochaetes bacterium ADurb.Bin133]HNZ27480.1 glycosyltransferase family 2 protein [Spirochaetota bacterium]HOF01856.1 glycosyltransferase family 2 protein [Spirochaetota bacterium]HOS33855.1 glycosyltransferase family 2 protein [Spirochaetota bacterium]HOS56846.1 glycosyltransferase family 2 protein [Spirochaetota bacterium]